ncbi:Peroxisome biogenesis protein 7 [Capsicum annuum]|nr:Peroxisome biogenesis protein 7 [Capsicum annuum]KAF3669838.1 Peroxisome biogenesis protein 7 [Capsicum annuum]
MILPPNHCQPLSEMPVLKTPFNDYSVTPNGPISEVTAFDTTDGIYDICWSEDHDSLVIGATSDGSLKLYDLSLPSTNNPISSFKEHTREVHSVDYNTVRKDSLLSASWDDTVKLWTVDRNASVRTFKEHTYCVYSAAWNLRHADIFASASRDYIMT